MRPFSSLRTVHYRLLAGLWTIGILLTIAIPTGSIPEVQSAFGLDKLVHAVLFSGFGLLWLRGLCPPDRIQQSPGVSGRSLLVLGAGVVFAGVTELYQHIAPIERVADSYDVAADLLGLTLAFAGYYLYAHWNERSPA